ADSDGRLLQRLANTGKRQSLINEGGHNRAKDSNTGRLGWRRNPPVQRSEDGKNYSERQYQVFSKRQLLAEWHIELFNWRCRRHIGIKPSAYKHIGDIQSD